MDADPLVFNGLEASTGDYALPPMTLAEMARAISGRGPAPGFSTELAERLDALKGEHLGPKEGIDPRDLAQSGWGVVFPADADPAVIEALRPLLAHRRRQAGRHREERYRELVYQPGESEWQFLDRHGADFGPADPEKLPYYLLLVGEPDAIPFDFQIELDVEYAVGRLAFDTAEEYAAYAESVVAVETGQVRPAAKATFFGVANADDLASQQSHDFLIEPLAQSAREGRCPTPPGWAVETVLAGGATKDRLSRLLGEDTPGLLFSASHGLCATGDPARQRDRQGALLCQDWPGPRAWKGRPIADDHVFTAADLASTARLRGLIAFHFGCYGGATPRQGAFPVPPQGTLPERDFVARLPRRLLAAGAQAVVAHLDQSWAYSYLGLRGGERLETFESTLTRLLAGHPVGSALDYFNRRYATVALALAREEQVVRLHGKLPDDDRLVRLWTASQDARGYLVLGDPAVRLAGITPQLG